MSMSQLDQLKSMTKVVADSSDFSSIQLFLPEDATTNPTLILQAAQKPEYRSILFKAIDFAQRETEKEKRRSSLLDRLSVLFGIELLRIIPGRVSTEIDATLSFDTKKSVERAEQIISFYEKEGISRDRILIKLASTWEGIQAAEILEARQIHCNMTLLFSLPQAVACARAKATLISPFVGRILDWNKQRGITTVSDPGVLSVKEIYNYYKHFGYTTQIMGASFRNKEQILELAGCDLLTISPTLLQELSNQFEPIERKLRTEIAQQQDIKKIDLNESSFRFMLNQNQMATEKLSEGIRNFVADTKKLEEFVQQEFGFA